MVGPRLETLVCGSLVTVARSTERGEAAAERLCDLVRQMGAAEVTRTEVPSVGGGQCHLHSSRGVLRFHEWGGVSVGDRKAGVEEPEITIVPSLAAIWMYGVGGADALSPMALQEARSDPATAGAMELFACFAQKGEVACGTEWSALQAIVDRAQRDHAKKVWQVAETFLTEAVARAGKDASDVRSAQNVVDRYAGDRPSQGIGIGRDAKQVRDAALQMFDALRADAGTHRLIQQYGVCDRTTDRRESEGGNWEQTTVRRCQFGGLYDATVVEYQAAPPLR